jgi:hypothetical protein
VQTVTLIVFCATVLPLIFTPGPDIIYITTSPRRGIGIAGEKIITADAAGHGIRPHVVKFPEAKRLVLLIRMAWKDKKRF